MVSEEQVKSQANNSLPEAIKFPMVKAIFDKALSGLLIILTAPFSLAILAGIIIDGLLNKDNRGPLFYIEERISHGKPFSLVKFRIFKMTAINMIREGQITKTVENQPENLTRIGKFLKKFGLDEIPQLFTILTGSMSFVGPRPKPTQEYKLEIAKGVYRGYLTRTGLSGPAQIMKGTKRTYEQEVEQDYAYIEKCRTLSRRRLLWLDITIVCKTIVVALGGPNE